MCALLVSFLLGNALVGSIDTLWTVDFSTQPSGWVAGPYWEYLDDSIFLYLLCGGGQSGYHSLEDSLLSPEFVVPTGADSLVLVFDHFWWGIGIANQAQEWAQSTSTLILHAPDISPTPIELWEVYASTEGLISLEEHFDVSLYKLYSDTISGPVSIPLIGVLPGNTLTFVFRGLVEAYVDDMAAWAEIYWNLYTFHILNYTEVSLERSTWGSIKTSF